MMKTRNEMKKNAFFIKVKKCCCSCTHKDLTRAVGSRWCEKHDKAVKPGGCCKCWRMSRQLQMAGFARGRVKRVEYLLYLAAGREDESLAEQAGMELLPKSIEEIRAAFEHQFGGIYEKL
jgi:hypothetical protein